jgi:hypothetical protein
MHIICTALLLAVSVAADPAPASPFQDIGVPIHKAGLMNFIVGPGPTEGTERLYFNFRQDGGKFFLVCVDPDTGQATQIKSPAGTGAYGFIVGPDNRIYLGTHEGPEPEDNGQMLVFDPRKPEEGIRALGRPAPSESYLWMYTLGPDGKIYGCTFPSAKLVSFDPKTGQLADLGVMDPDQKYTRSICTGPDGRIYLGVGFGRANVVVYDPKTGEHKAILPEEYRKAPEQTLATVYTGEDGNVYATAIAMTVLNGDPENGELTRPESVTLRFKGDACEEVNPAETPGATQRHPELHLKDGRVLSNATLDGDYTLTKPDGTSETKHFDYKSDGAGLFMVANGPLGRIYGSSAMPCQIFSYDPASGALENPGNPTEVAGEIYSMLDHHGTLYVCAYPESFLSKWDPSKPWNYGRTPESNPRGLGPLGPGHLRPRAMVHGPDEKLYIGSYPEYGRHGGSLGVWDPAADRLVENYHPLIPNQSVVTLAFDPQSGLVFGGSSTAGGGGTNPVEPEAKFFAFDPAKKALKFAETPFPGMQNLRSMALLGRRIYGVADDDKLFVYDIDKGEYIHKAPIGLGPVPDCSLAPWKDGKLYGLAGNKVFRFDPDALKAEVLAEYTGTVGCGFAIDDHGIYFGDRAKLVRYNWPATTP